MRLTDALNASQAPFATAECVNWAENYPGFQSRWVVRQSPDGEQQLWNSLVFPLHPNRLDLLSCHAEGVDDPNWAITIWSPPTQPGPRRSWRVDARTDNAFDWRPVDSERYAAFEHGPAGDFSPFGRGSPDRYSVEQAARELGVSAERVRQLAASRKRGVRIGQRVLMFTRSDLLAMSPRSPGRPKNASKE